MRVIRIIMVTALMSNSASYGMFSFVTDLFSGNNSPQQETKTLSYQVNEEKKVQPTHVYPTMTEKSAHFGVGIGPNLEDYAFEWHPKEAKVIAWATNGQYPTIVYGNPAEHWTTIDASEEFRQAVKFNKSTLATLLAYKYSANRKKGFAGFSEAIKIVHLGKRESTTLQIGKRGICGFEWSCDDHLVVNSMYPDQEHDELVTVFHVDAAKVGQSDYKPQEKCKVPGGWWWASFIPSGKLFLVQEFSKALKLHDATNGDLKKQWEIDKPVSTVYWKADGLLVSAIASSYDKLYLIAPDKNEKIELQLPNDHGVFRQRKWQGDYLPLFSRSNKTKKSYIKIYDAKTGKYCVELLLNERVYDIALNPGATKLAIVQNEKLVLYDIKNKTTQEVELGWDNGTFVQWNANGSLIAVSMIGRNPIIEYFTEQNNTLISLRELSKDKRDALLRKM